MKTDLPSREAKLAGEAEQKKKNTSIIKSSSFPFWSWQKLIKTDEIQSVSTEESAKHENKVEQQAQFSWKHSCPDDITLTARVDQYKHR